MNRALVPAVAAVLLVALHPARPAAHEVPSAVRVQVFVKPEAQTLRLLIRVPLASINDVPWPEVQPGVLDL